MSTQVTPGTQSTNSESKPSAVEEGEIRDMKALLIEDLNKIAGMLYAIDSMNMPMDDCLSTIRDLMVEADEKRINEIDQFSCEYWEMGAAFVAFRLALHRFYDTVAILKCKADKRGRFDLDYGSMMDRQTFAKSMVANGICL
jgi:hypothetical protein